MPAELRHDCVRVSGAFAESGCCCLVVEIANRRMRVASERVAARQFGIFEL